MSPSIMSMDTVFVIHYMDALKELQNTWLNKEGMNKDTFGLQLEYIIRLIPDEAVQAKIQAKRKELKKEYDKDQDEWADVRAGLVVVTEIINFICSAFDLMHMDIVGPATSKQYRDKDIEIPDMAIETISPMEPKKAEAKKEQVPGIQLPIAPE